MTIWVDADACPNVIKEILYRAAERMQYRLSGGKPEPASATFTVYSHFTCGCRV